MTWVIRNQSDERILKEIHEQTDRGMALIATAYLEDRLLGAIKARLNHNTRIEKSLFTGLGGLASFSARIDIGLLLGIYEKGVHRVLHGVRRIRNEFTHSSDPLSFASQKISDLCKSVEIHGKIDATVIAPNGGVSRIAMEFKPSDTPREIFLNSIKFLLFVMDVEINTGQRRKPSSPVLPPIGSVPRSKEGKKF